MGSGMGREEEHSIFIWQNEISQCLGSAGPSFGLKTKGARGPSPRSATPGGVLRYISDGDVRMRRNC